MALKTIGTPAATSLQGFQYSPDPASVSNTDFAALVNQIYEDGGFGAPPNCQNGRGNLPGSILQGGFSRSGQLFLPGSRSGADGLRVYPGDWVAVDLFGTPFIIPQRCLPKTLVASATLTNAKNSVTFAASVLALGWQVGTPIASSHTPANAVIGTIAPDGKTITMVTINANGTPVAANATGSATENMTAGSFTHS